MGTVIRPLREEDADDLAALHLRTWRAAYGGLLPASALDAVDVPERAAAWRRRAREDVSPTWTLVAESGGSLVGFISFGVPRDDDLADLIEIYALYVDPTSWSTGVGRDLLGAGVAAIAASGGTATYLWVLEDNPRARRFYERVGFVADGTRKEVDFIGTLLPELRYRRTGLDSAAR